MNRRVALVLRLLVCLPLLASVSACSDEEPSCVAETLDAQPTRRFVAGHTFYLPKLAARCASAGWAVTQAPAGSANAVVPGADGWSRFTPARPGDYVFEAADGAERVTLRVIASSAAPFHNYNYYPSRSLLRVDGSLWVADVFGSRLSVLDAGTLAVTKRVAVGAWPVALGWVSGMKHVLVAQRGSDTLGFVDIARGEIVDAVWVGDEPSNVLISPDGARAFVSLATDNQVAVVDIAKREVIRRIDVGRDPLAMAIDAKGGRLFVASHRSGHTDRYPYGTDPVAEQKDITIVNIADGRVLGSIDDVATMINGLLYDADQQRLLVASRDNDVRVSLTDAKGKSFVHQVLAVAARPGPVQRLASADLGRQASSGGFAVALHGMALCDGKLWVAAEGSDLAVALDPRTLVETARVKAAGRPRALICDVGGVVLVHGHQSYALTRGGGAAAPREVSLGDDPRPIALAAGQRFFTGAGRDYAQSWTCNSCHAQGLTDKLVWNAGPFSDRVVARPMFWLQGTYPLGWAGYLANVRNYAMTVTTNVGVRLTTAEHAQLLAYMSSLTAPPPANSHTRRDGSLSAAGQAGKRAFEQAGCASCHVMPLGTTRASLADGLVAGSVDIPSVVGAYRFGVWLKQGQSRTLADAVRRMARWRNVTLDDAKVESITRYLRELTGRDMFVLSSEPRQDSQSVASDRPLRLVFSRPPFDSADNLAAVTLARADGTAVDATVSVSGRVVTVTPRAPLAHDTRYKLAVGGAFQSFGERRVGQDIAIAFKTAKAPTLVLDGNYVWTVDVPAPDFTKGIFDPARTLPAPVSISARKNAAGAALVIDYGQGLTLQVDAVVEGDTLISGPLPVPAGNSFADSDGIRAKLVDSDGDGVADSAAGTLTFTGPGFVVPSIRYTFARAAAPGKCDVGGDAGLTVDTSAPDAPMIRWTDGPALGLYVTAPGARLPLGPGSKVGGKAFWVLEAETFPNGFDGPVSYGSVPKAAKENTAFHGGPAGGAKLQSGRCYTFSVFTTGFKILKRTVLWP